MDSRAEPSPVMEALARVAPKIDAGYEQYLKDGQQVKAWSTFVEIVSQEPCLFWKQHTPCTFVGVWPGNRGGMGVSVTQAITNGCNHIASGYSLAKASEDAWAVQSLQQTAAHLEAMTFNTELSKKQGLLPLSDLVLQSFGGTNNNVFLRAVKTGAPCTSKKIAPSGNLDAEKLSNESQHLADALKSGLEWNIVRGEVAKRWPSYISLGSNALNTRGTSEVSELEGMMTMQQTYKHPIEVLKHSPLVAGEIAVAEAIRSQPFWRGWASALLQLAMCVTPEQLKEAAQCKAAVVKVPDGVGNTYGFCGGQYLEKAASISFPNSLIQYPRIKMAAFTANILSPIDKIFDGKYS